jgi:hypothetical protein
VWKRGQLFLSVCDFGACHCDTYEGYEELYNFVSRGKVWVVFRGSYSLGSLALANKNTPVHLGTPP